MGGINDFRLRLGRYLQQEIHTATYLSIFVKITLISASVLCTAEERHSNVRSHECTKIRAYTSSAGRSTSDATSIYTDNTRHIHHPMFAQNKGNRQ